MLSPWPLFTVHGSWSCICLCSSTITGFIIVIIRQQEKGNFLKNTAIIEILENRVSNPFSLPWYCCSQTTATSTLKPRRMTHPRYYNWRNMKMQTLQGPSSNLFQELHVTIFQSRRILCHHIPRTARNLAGHPVPPGSCVARPKMALRVQWLSASRPNPPYRTFSHRFTFFFPFFPLFTLLHIFLPFSPLFPRFSFFFFFFPLFLTHFLLPSQALSPVVLPFSTSSPFFPFSPFFTICHLLPFSICQLFPLLHFFHFVSFVFLSFWIY